MDRGCIIQGYLVASGSKDGLAICAWWTVCGLDRVCDGWWTDVWVSWESLWGSGWGLCYARFPLSGWVTQKSLTAGFLLSHESLEACGWKAGVCKSLCSMRIGRSVSQGSLVATGYVACSAKSVWKLVEMAWFSWESMRVSWEGLV